MQGAWRGLEFELIALISRMEFPGGTNYPRVFSASRVDSGERWFG